MNERLLSCPFCGNADVTLMTRRGKDGWRDRFYVLCGYDDGGCGASGEWTHYTDEAVSAWNRRATGKRDAKGEMIYAGDELGMRSTRKRGTVFYNAEDAAFEVKLKNGVCIGLDAESEEYERVRGMGD